MKKIVLMLAMISTPLYAANRVNLMQQPFMKQNLLSAGASNINLIETSRVVDANKMLHIRVQETYAGYKVWGADAVMHIPHTRNQTLAKNTYMNGIVYQNIRADLPKMPNHLQAQKALEKAIDQYQHKIGLKTNVQEQKNELMVYVDENNKAHWAYKTSFFVPSLKSGTLPARPTFIMDAITLHVYEEWNDIQTATVAGGGFGGNPKSGQLSYDGLLNHLPAFTVTRDDVKRICTLENPDIVVMKGGNRVINYKCGAPSNKHNKLYWNGVLDAANGGFSPSNDALFGGTAVKRLYQDWYNLLALKTPSGSPMVLNMFVHDKKVGANAYWDGHRNEMVFGDGDREFYPMTSLGITAHEVSHGFTEQNSGLSYRGQSGGMNESFSDMAAQAAEVYVYGAGKNTWKIGAEVFKRGDQVIRYLDTPSRDCNGGAPGLDCSIDNANQYYQGLDVHYSSGVYNRFFYLLSTSAGWDVRQAFDVMVQANLYWTSNTNFNSGACLTVQAATDLKRDVSAVKAAFDAVAVDYTDKGQCKIHEVV